MVALFERATGLGPAQFLNANDREVYESAARDRVRFQAEVDRLNAREQTARYQGAPLPDDEIRRIASYQQSFNEMTRGEQFVQDVLRAKARTRERWTIGLPAVAIAIAGLWLLARRLRVRMRQPVDRGRIG
jgi:zinc/manganese transport system permease protein